MVWDGDGLFVIGWFEGWDCLVGVYGLCLVFDVLDWVVEVGCLVLYGFWWVWYEYYGYWWNGDCGGNIGCEWLLLFFCVFWFCMEWWYFGVGCGLIYLLGLLGDWCD